MIFISPSKSAQTALLVASLLIPALTTHAAAPSKPAKPNVIFFATDDLNDWVGPLNSGIRAKTPNLDRLAARGVTFQNAQACGTFCAPSRTALFTGRHPSTTGAYTTQVYHHDRPELRPMQVAFQQGGYATYGTGKLFHHPAGYVDLRGWTEFNPRTPAQRKTGWPVDSWRSGAPLPTPEPYSKFTREMRAGTDRTFMEYAPLPNEVEKDMADTQQTEWAINVLKRAHTQPFFLALGLYAPHFPNYAPQKYYDLYPLDEIKLPPTKDGDTDDLPPAIKKFNDRRKATIHDKLNELGEMKEVIRAYLACISYADAMLGRVLDALDASAARDNTVVIFWSDQGYHHGEKGHWGKHSLWERTANIPFIWAGPGIARRANVNATVSAIDTFPTLVELCGLAPDASLEGQSLANVLRQPAQAKDRNVLLCDVLPGGYAIVNNRWRYIHHADGAEELYDVVKDPNEWDNLAPQESYRTVMAELRQSAPKEFVAPGPETNALRLVTEGENFRWEPKPVGSAKKAKSAK
ncbi:MAG: iduronate sulfatase [Opitutia bacterium Tous-C4FEB]|nr:MAG: iduronate sulfatase [Opitutae bacterium Tous-C5TDCM]PAW91231.1 MAG: iduronate sulfatase [Opitutae bacterium Tous-C4FEB]